MRLPWGPFEDILRVWVGSTDIAILGCLSPEERCLSVPLLASRYQSRWMYLLDIRDPPDAFPDHSQEAARKVAVHHDELRTAGVDFQQITTQLLATEDELLELISASNQIREATCVVLDITAMPKRYWCFFLKRLLRSEFERVLVTYAHAGVDGYPREPEPLAEDVMTPDHLPGFAGSFPQHGNTLVVSVGLELLSLRSLLDVYSGPAKLVRLLMAFPSDPLVVRRGWGTVRRIVGMEVTQLNRRHIAVAAPWDSEHVFRVLDTWDRDADGLALAPFGPKPHTLGMALFAIQRDVGMFYTQPKSYNPDYSRGRGSVWGYVVKWDGVACYDRPSVVL
jgi:hypothetical protein